MHLDDGLLRAHLDGEIGDAGLKAQFDQHLAGCEICQGSLAELRQQLKQVEGRLSFLAQPESTAQDSLPLSSEFALAKFIKRYQKQKETPMLQKIFRNRSVWAGLAVLAVLVIGLSIPSGRAWAGQFLGLFRVQQVAVIPIDPTRLTALNNDTSLAKQISQMLSSSVTFDKKPGDPQPAADAAQAGQLAGFTVRLPADQATQPKLTVQGGTAFKFVVDRARAQALLDEAGRSDLVLPASLDNANIAVNIPNAVTAAYGNCPEPAPASKDSPIRGSNGRLYADCVMLAEIPSPTVNTPPDVDFGKLAELGLEFTGMTPEQAQQFSQSVDWTSSLVIPLPKNAATYKQLTVDGVNGTLIQRPADDAPEYALIWVKNGIIYTIGGLGSDSAKAIEMANAMK